MLSLGLVAAASAAAWVVVAAAGAAAAAAQAEWRQSFSELWRPSWAGPDGEEQC